jgi:hypothetical protein
VNRPGFPEKSGHPGAPGKAGAVQDKPARWEEGAKEFPDDEAWQAAVAKVRGELAELEAEGPAIHTRED